MTMILDGTNGEVFPTWTTATRPASPVTSQTGWNTTIGSLENYNGTAWTAVGGGGAGQWQSVQTTGFTAVSGNAYACNTTSAAFTVTLPASPAVGSYIQLVDYAGTWNTNNVTLNPNGLKIAGSTSNVALTINRQAVAIVYIDSTQGWLCYSQGSNIGQYTASYLVVAGGGSGASGGGGAGGLLTSTVTITSGTSYAVSVGAGGTGSSGAGTNGTNSSLTTIAIAVGGGAGDGGSGGSGGGGASSGAPSSGGSGTSGQGNAGGGNGGYFPGGYPAGGGGGAGAVGGAAGGLTSAGNGGAGLASSLSGASTFYAGGGGGGLYQGTGSAGTGGSGGGGNGGYAPAGGAGTNASANTGGGGGGRSASTPSSAGNGGSGIVIISYVGAQRGTGGTITTSGGSTIHTFTTSGTYVG